MASISNCQNPSQFQSHALQASIKDDFLFLNIACTVVCSLKPKFFPIHPKARKRTGSPFTRRFREATWVILRRSCWFKFLHSLRNQLRLQCSNFYVRTSKRQQCHVDAAGWCPVGRTERAGAQSCLLLQMHDFEWFDFFLFTVRQTSHNFAKAIGWTT